mmetsp:Transcript_43756/g.109781  ORF Transcript_43756/g.109781 Transcript_43756/m.109781 type:complete len:292 (-) Transcript_43756:310-1185(-)
MTTLPARVVSLFRPGRAGPSSGSAPSRKPRRSGMGEGDFGACARTPQRAPRRAIHCSAGGLDGFTAAAATCSALGIAFSLARRRPEPAQPTASPADADDGFFGWFLAAFLSLVPLANWTAWLVAAQLEDAEAEDSSSPTLCYAFAALYALPLLHGGIAPDASDVLILALGALHLQVERVAQTDPGALSALPAPSRSAGLPLGSAAAAAGAALAKLGERLAARSTSDDGKEDKDGSGSGSALEDYAAAELQEFDEKLQKSPPGKESEAPPGDGRRSPMVIEESRQREPEDTW